MTHQTWARNERNGHEWHRRQQIHQELNLLAQRGLDSFSLRREFIRRLREAVPFGACSLPTMDPGTLMLATTVTDSLPHGDCMAILSNEYLEPDLNKLSDLTRSRYPVGILGDAAGVQPEASRRYRDLLKPMGIRHELRAVCVADGVCWGAIVLYRWKGEQGFQPHEADVVAAAAGALARGLRQAALLQRAVESSEAAAPGLVIMGEDGRISLQNETAERYMRELVDDGWPHALDTPPPALSALAARARMADSQGPPPHLRFPTGSGRWLALHASPVRGEGAGGSVAIIMEEPQATEVAPVLLRAYGLSDREAEVARLAMAGRSNAEISAQLFISHHTVQDHLKAVFTKTGVSGRQELSGRIFLRHYYEAYLSGHPS